MSEPRFSDEFTARYRVTGKLGEGGMGVVYSAVQVGLDRPVALKVMKSARADDVARFVREGRTLSAVASPDIVAVIDAGVDGELPYLVLEFIEGLTLDVHIKKARPKIVDALAWVSGTAAALAAAHERAVLHRDVKPANVFLCGDGRVKLADFGLARDSATGQTLTAAGAVMGTLAYMAPEQVRGDRATGATDVFQLGVMAFELVTGCFPFTGPTPMQAAMSRLERDAPRPCQVAPLLPRELDGLLARMLTREPAGRLSAPQVVEAIGELAAALDPEQLVARPSAARVTGKMPALPRAPGAAPPAAGTGGTGVPRAAEASGGAATGAASFAGASSGVATGPASFAGGNSGVATGPASFAGVATGPAPVAGATTGAAPVVAPRSRPSRRTTALTSSLATAAVPAAPARSRAFTVGAVLLVAGLAAAGLLALRRAPRAPEVPPPAMPSASANPDAAALDLAREIAGIPYGTLDADRLRGLLERARSTFPALFGRREADSDALRQTVNAVHRLRVFAHGDAKLPPELDPTALLTGAGAVARELTGIAGTRPAGTATFDGWSDEDEVPLARPLPVVLQPAPAYERLVMHVELRLEARELAEIQLQPAGGGAWTLIAREGEGLSRGKRDDWAVYAFELDPRLVDPTGVPLRVSAVRLGPDGGRPRHNYNKEVGGVSFFGRWADPELFPPPAKLTAADLAGNWRWWTTDGRRTGSFTLDRSLAGAVKRDGHGTYQLAVHGDPAGPVVLEQTAAEGKYSDWEAWPGAFDRDPKGVPRLRATLSDINEAQSVHELVALHDERAPPAAKDDRAVPYREGFLASALLLQGLHADPRSGGVRGGGAAGLIVRMSLTHKLKPPPGNYRLVLHYANGGAGDALRQVEFRAHAAKQGSESNLLLSDGPVRQLVRFKSTGSWSTWADAVVPFEVGADELRVEIRTTDDPAGRADLILSTVAVEAR